MQRITVVSVPVTDQDRAMRFYIDEVGFELLAHTSFGDGLGWVQVGPKGSEASLTLVTWFEDMRAGSLRGLVVDSDDLDADYRAMNGRGVRFLGPPSQQPGGVFATFVDPDGNQISLRQAGSSNGETEGLVREE
jgi:catechol 2,3-dioxygenase-like lactoylglutathione lyase family enzyme